MKIDNNSYYLRYFADSKGNESASLVYYKEVWENGLTEDVYNISIGSIYFEDAGWNGINLNRITFGTKIPGRYYKRWKKEIDDLKVEIENMVKSSAQPYGQKWEEGMYLYFPYKEIFAIQDAESAEEDDYEDDEDYEEPVKYDGPNFELVCITNADPLHPEGTEIRVGEYIICYSQEPWSQEYFLDYIEVSRIITQSVYDEIIELINKKTAELLSQMKKMVKTIEER